MPRIADCDCSDCCEHCECQCHADDQRRSAEFSEAFHSEVGKIGFCESGRIMQGAFNEFIASSVRGFKWRAEKGKPARSLTYQFADGTEIEWRRPNR